MEKAFLRKSRKIVVFSVLIWGGIVFAVHAAMAAAVVDEAETVHIKDSDVEEATLIIGTHLIYLASMTDELYKAAQETAAKSGQNVIYYKSELAGGAWFDIASASGIGDISYAGTPVETSTIEALNVRYYTKSDKVTYDLTDNTSVCIFNLNNPYDVSDNSDFDELTSVKEMLDEKEPKTASDNYYSELLKDFYEADTTSEDTDRIDGYLDSLQQYYQNNTDDSQAQNVMLIMRKLDSTRRALVNGKLSESVSELLDKAAMPDADVTVNDVVVSAVASSIRNMEASSIEYNSDKISDGEQIYTRTENAMFEEVINAAVLKDSAAVSAALGKLEALWNIENGLDVDSQAELDILNGSMIPEAFGAVEQAVLRGAGKEYGQLAAEGASAKQLAQALKKQKSELEKLLDQLAYLNKSAALRLSAAEAEAYLERQAQEGEKLLDLTPQDAFAPYAREAVNAYMDNMEKERETYGAGGSNVLDKLISDKENLEFERRKALDRNDLETVRDCDAKLEEQEKKIAEREAKLNAILESTNSTSAEKADALAELGSSTVSEKINEIKEKAFSDIGEGAYEYVSGEAEAISALSVGAAQTAKNALTDMYRQLVLTQSLEDGLSQEEKDTISAAIEEIEKILVENKDIFIGNNVSEEAVYRLVRDETGISFYDLPYARQAAVLEAVYELGDDIDSAVLENTAASMASYMYGHDNPYVFPKLKNEPEKYIPLENLALCTDYRYIYSDSLREGILQKGSGYYRFDAFDKEVIRSGGISEQMKQSARLQNGLYIPEEYASGTFGCRCSYIYKSDYAVLYENDMEEEIEDFYKALTDLSL